ncbi:hypothetical protein B6N25_06100 [Sphingobacteriales bacterium TSM_CSS]|nr:hypothetical protein B6N25_06100 [Sphingobacteriales bacterium TSM_CSS]
MQAGKANVLFFLDTGCPISRQMTLYIRQLESGADTAKVVLLLVFQPPEKKARISRFLSTYRLQGLPS